MTKQELELIRRAKQDDEAFEAFMKHFYNSAYYFALRITNCDADAKDAVQEAFVQMKHSLPDLREEKTFYKWMQKIIISKCNKIFRKNHYTILDPDVINTMTITESRTYMQGKAYVDQKSRKDIVLQCLQKLTYAQREILILSHYMHLSIADIAQLLDIPQGTVKSRMASARQALKREVERFEKEEGIRIHSFVLPILLYLGLHKELQKTKPFPYKGNARKLTYGMSGILAGVALWSIFTYASQQLSEPTKDASMQYESVVENTMSGKQLYRLLKEKGHCEVEIEQMSNTEIQELMPYYQQLKEQDNAYYRRLCQNDWCELFEKRSLIEKN